MSDFTWPGFRLSSESAKAIEDALKLPPGPPSDYMRAMGAPRFTIGEVQYLCGLCLTPWGTSQAAAQRCYDSHPRDQPPANEDR